MLRGFVARVATAVLFAALVADVTAGDIKAASVKPADTRVGAITVHDAWTRPTAAGMPMGVAYFTLVNHGNVADAVVAASTPLAASVEMHQTTVVDGMMRMRPLPEIALPARGTVAVAPNGIHLMLVDLKAPLAAGTQVPLVLQFRHAGRVEIRLAVQARTE
ncbi:MAG TPA: copper chaperone PCu(A)C [Steroidobacteraceae bacterium]|nr:copper chaperone PCu(A)C [Steroidobacteraceae bacterium]